MTGPAATSSPDIPHPQPQGGTGSGSGSTGGPVAAGAGEGGSSSPLSVRSRPVTRSAAAMSSGRSTRQQQSKSTTASPITPADKLRHQHHQQQQQQQPTTPPPTKGNSSTSAGGAAKRGEVSVNTPPPTAPPAATTSTTTTTSARSPATARSAGSGQSNTTPTPTTQTNTSGGASHHYQTRHSYHPLESSTHQQQESGPAARASAGNNRKRSAATASIDTTASNTSAGTGGNQQFDDPRIDRRSLDTPITANTPGTATSPTSYRGSGFGTGSSSGGGGPAGPELMCLCAKEPKVPRPRNAFILYRQHHQSQTVAANPGTANPEISKIIGAQWKNEPEERKAQWKRLADEEKLRHQQQYPGYKYTPRRSKSAKGGSGADSAVSTPLSATFPSLGDGERPDGPGRCPKCGGRDIAIATPRTPSTPFPGRMFSANISGFTGIAAAMPSGGVPPTPSQGGGAGSGNWGEGAPRHKRGTSVDVGGEYYRERDRRQQQQQFPQYQYGSSTPGSTPYPHNYPPQHGGPGGGGGGYTPYLGANERDRMMNARNWPPPPPSGPPSAYDQPPPPSFRDRLYDIRKAKYEMGTPVAASPSDAKRRRYNDGEYYRHQQAPLSPPPPMGYGGPPPPPGGPGQGQYGYPPGPPPPHSPHPRSSIHGPPPGSGPGQPPLLTRSTPTMGPPPPPRGGSTTPVYHSQPAQPDPRPHSGSGSRGGGGGGRGSSHRDQARERDAEFEQPLRLPPLQTHLPPQDQTSLPPTAASGRLGGSSSTSPMELSSATPTGVTMAGGLNISYAAMGGSGRFPDSAIDLTLDDGNGGRRLSLPGGSVGASQTGPPERIPYKAPGTRAMATIRPKSGPSSITSQPLSSSSSINPSHKRKLDAMSAGEGPTGTSREEKSALEAMIMSMHYLSKLTVLSEKIVCPLPLPGAGNHPQAGGKTVRGPIIAIEGTNPILMKAVALAVEKALKSGNICRLRKWEGAAGPLSFSAESERAEKTPIPSGTRQASESASKRSKSASGSAARADEEVERAGVPGSSSSAAGDAAGRASGSPSETKTPAPAAPVPVPVPGSGSSSKDAAGETAGSKAGSQAPGSRTSSVGSIHSHHSEKSHHTEHSHHSEKSHHSHHSQNTRHSDRSSTSVVIIQDNKPSNPYVSYWTELSAWHIRSAEITNFVTGQTTTTAASSSSPARESSPTENDLLPVALLPSGYCLTYSDRFACSTQISDNYAPVDHWQWMATMWRGLVAPDLTIYVLDEASPFARDHLHGEDEYGAGGYDSGQTVEFKRTNLKMAVMVVRLNEAFGGLLEKTERRLGFEVLEWVRNGPFSGVIGDGEIL